MQSPEARCGWHVLEIVRRPVQLEHIRREWGAEKGW